MPAGDFVADQDWKDDDQLSSNEFLWRRIKREYIKPHPTPSGFIASQQAYRTKEISFYIASQTTIQDVLSNYPTESLTAVPVSYIREELGLIIVRDPKDTDPNPAHRVVGRKDHICITGSPAKKIANKAVWVVLKHPETGMTLIPGP